MDLRTVAGAKAGVGVNAGRPVGQPLRERVLSWMQRPVPAAFGGALAAAALVLSVMSKGRPARDTVEEAAAAPTSPAMVAFDNDFVDDGLAEVDLDGLQTLDEEMDRTLAQGTDAAGESDEQVLASPAALSEELEELNEAGLALLAEDLGEAI